jgi:actin-related protein 6
MVCRQEVSAGISRFMSEHPFAYTQLCFYSGFRLDVGGKLLTNQLKELVSFRQWNMMDETYIMNHVKESCCYVSTDFKKDLEICRYVSLYFFSHCPGWAS